MTPYYVDVSRSWIFEQRYQRYVAICKTQHLFYSRRVVEILVEKLDRFSKVLETKRPLPTGSVRKIHFYAYQLYPGSVAKEKQ